LRLAAVENCFQFNTPARAWFDDVEDDLGDNEDFESSFREGFIAGEESLVKLQQQWELSRQGQHTARSFFKYLLTLRLRTAYLDSEEKLSERDFLRKFCGNLREPTRTAITKKRITEPGLTLSQIVKLAELEERSVRKRDTALRSFDSDYSCKLKASLIILTLNYNAVIAPKFGRNYKLAKIGD
jgi:hypothetical protein